MDWYWRNPIIPRKDDKPLLNFYGRDDGSFIETSDFLLSWRRDFDWEMITRMSSRNNWNIYHVEGATEYNPGFREALCQMVDKYPELVDYLITFDGPPKSIVELLNPAVCADWGDIEFLHGTSGTLLEPISAKGLLPRDITGMPSTYGSEITRAKPGRMDAIYLTTQMGMARFAARDACRLHGGNLLILSIVGIDSCNAIPDIDSGELTAELSLQRIGAIGYVGHIPPQIIRIWGER